MSEPVDIQLTELPDFGDHFTVAEFTGAVKCGAIINSDGEGFYAIATQESNIEAYPRDFAKGKIRDDFTHVMWYNK